MDKMREEFEAWAINCDLCTFAVGDEYKYMTTEWAWRAWKASRAALCVELPRTPSFNASDEPDLAFEEGVDVMKEIIEAVGVTCK